MAFAALVEGLGRHNAQLSLVNMLFLTVFGVLLFPLLLAVYRICFHPLAQYPGPRLAGASYWYEYYYDVTKKGKYIWKILDLHRQYGPIVRINPNELHVSDPDFFGEIYHGNRWRTDRDRWYNLDFLGQGLAFTIGHDLHHIRRQAISPYFSMQSIRTLEPRITTVVQQMIDRLHESHQSGSAINLYHVFSGYALDIITEYAFGKQGSMNFMSNPEFGKYWSDLTMSQLPMNNFARQFKVVMQLMLAIPESIMVIVNPLFARYMDWNNMLLKQVRKILNEEKASPAVGDAGITVFHELKNSGLPPQEKGEMRLKDEANMIVGAGGETTAATLSRTFYHLLENLPTLEKLRDELKLALPNPQQMPSLADLQRLPYLNAIVEEGIRISFPVLARSPRVFQDHALQFGEWTIEPGTAISMSPYMVTASEKVFPDPFKFKPERWLDNKELQKYQVSFGKGRRACLGKNLAYAELLFAIAVICRNFELELFETTREDVDIKHDFFLGLPKLDSEGVRVKVVKELS